MAAPEACDSWKEWAAAVKAAAEGELEEGASGKLTPAAIRGLLQVWEGFPCWVVPPGCAWLDAQCIGYADDLTVISLACQNQMLMRVCVYPAASPLPQSKLQQLEEALLAESVGGLAADGDSSDGEGSEEGVGEEGQGSEEGSPAQGGGLSRSQASRRPLLRLPLAHSTPVCLR